MFWTLHRKQGEEKREVKTKKNCVDIEEEQGRSSKEGMEWFGAKCEKSRQAWMVGLEEVCQQEGVAGCGSIA